MPGDLRFVLSDSVADTAARAFAAQESRIRAVLPDAEVRHRGGSSLPGVLTLGDVDVHVRVDAASFAFARGALCELYEPLHADVWHAEWAFLRRAGVAAARRGRAHGDRVPRRLPPR